MKIIKSLEKQFVFIIVDGGSDIDNGLVLGSLAMGGINVLVLTQNESVLTRWEQQKIIYQGLSINFDQYVVNKYDNSHPYSLPYIKERLKLGENFYYKIPISPYGCRAEWEKKSLMQYGKSAYKNEISGMVKKLEIVASEKGNMG